MGFRGPEALKDNLEQRGDCQTRRKSYKATGIVGWVVGWKIDARSPYPNKGSGAAYACYCLSLTGSSHPQHFRPAFPEWQCASWTCLAPRSEEHTSELQSHLNLVCRLLLEKKK